MSTHLHTDAMCPALRNELPDDETLDEMDRSDLRELASGVSGLDGNAPTRKLRKWLSRVRDGGIPMECNRGHKWVYAGNRRASEHEPVYVTCPTCKSSVPLPRHGPHSA